MSELELELKKVKQAYNELTNKTLEDIAEVKEELELMSELELELKKVKQAYNELADVARTLKEETDYERLGQLNKQMKEENEIRYGLKDYVAKPPERKYKIVAAKYVLYSKFTIPDDRDIEDAHAYWVKWDKLHVIWSEGQEKEEYEPYDAADQMESWKRPDSVFPGYYVDEVEECD